MIETWTLVRFLHILAIVFFVGGQLLLVAAVAPAIRRYGDDRAMRAIARRFGIGSIGALAVAVTTGVLMASHFALWESQVLRAKLLVLVLVGVLTGLHIVTPRSRTLSYAVAIGSLAVLWLGVKLTYG